MEPFKRCSLPSALGPLEFYPLGAEDLSDIDRLEQAAGPNPWTRANIASSLDSRHRGLGLRCNSVLIAFAFISLTDVEAELLLISVAKEFQGRGFGRMFLSTLIEQLQGRASDIFLEVRPSNTAALALYESLGFNQVGVRQGYYPGPRGAEDAWVMGMSLDLF